MSREKFPSHCLAPRNEHREAQLGKKCVKPSQTTILVSILTLGPGLHEADVAPLDDSTVYQFGEVNDVEPR